MHPSSRFRRSRGLSLSIVAITLLIAGLLAAGFVGYIVGYRAASKEISSLRDQIQELSQRLTRIQSSMNASATNVVYHVLLGENISLSQIYERVKDSVVVIRGIRSINPFEYELIQGSGFIYNFSGQMVVITNYHVVYGSMDITVTFANRNGYAASILGYDPYADLAVLSVDAPKSEYHPLELADSSTLKVGDLVIAIGNPYGLAGSMSIGIVSALRRTITEDLTGGYPIANVIQTTAPINPGNSGGPLLNSRGQVIGITTAIVSGSQGIGFAIPSNTILREIESLIKEGSYNKHPWLGASGIDMTYEIARAMGSNVTYGWLITQVVSGGPADRAGLRGGTRIVYVAGERIIVGGDIIIAVNGEKITGIDDLLSYLEEHTTPGQKINVTVVRESQIITVEVELGSRPPLR